MAKKKNEWSKTNRAIAKAIVEQYKPTTVEEMQDTLRDIFWPRECKIKCVSSK